MKPCVTHLLPLVVAAAGAVAAPASADVIAQWEFELPAGAALGAPLVGDTDSVGGHVATASGAATYGTASPTGGTASAQLGSSSYLAVPDSDALTGHANGGTGFTRFEIELDLRLNALIESGTQQIVRKTGLEGNNTPGFELYAQSNGLIGFTINGATTTHKTQSTGVLTSADTWYHVLAVWDGEKVTLQVDGQAVGTPATYTGPFINTDVPMGIGALIRSNGSTGQQFNGSIDNLTIRGVVPEPASMALLAAGVLAMARRRTTPQ